MNQIPSQSENPAGLHLKYLITKTNGEPLSRGNYFVLKYDSDTVDDHVRASREALLTYAEYIADTFPQLAEDIKTQIKQLKEQENT